MSSSDSSFRVSIGNLSKSLDGVNKSLEKLASGKRINRAADDAAGLAIAEQLSSQATTFSQASNNVSYGQSLLSIKDGALQQIGDIGTRLQELSTQSANGTLSDDQRQSIKQEYDALTSEADRIVQSTEFNGQKVFSGSSTDLQVGITSGPESQISIGGTDVSAQIAALKAQDVSTQAGAKAALDTGKAFIESVASERGQIGSVSSRLQTASQNIDVAAENLRSAESRIRDVDVAQEVANKIANDIRSQTSVASFAQSKLSAANVLKLLK